MRAFVRVPLSFVFSLWPLHSLSGYLSVSLFLFCIHTLSHAVTRSLSSTHSQTHTLTKSVSPSFSLTHTHFSLFLSLSRSFSLPLSLSLLHTYTDTHTHSHTHTLSLEHSLIHSFIVVACARCVVFSVRTRARSLLCVSPPLPTFHILVLAIPSLLLSSSPLARLLPCRLSLTRSLPLFLNSW